MRRVDWPVVIGLLLGLVIALVVPVGVAVAPGGYGGEFNERVILDVSQVQSPSDVADEDLATEVWLQQEVEPEVTDEDSTVLTEDNWDWTWGPLFPRGGGHVFL